MYPGVRNARVNSIHHQGIKDLAPGFEVEAWSIPDRMPEAIRRTRRAAAAATSRPRNGIPEFHS